MGYGTKIIQVVSLAMASMITFYTVMTIASSNIATYKQGLIIATTMIMYFIVGFFVWFMGEE